MNQYKKIGIAAILFSLLSAIAARGYWELICKNEKNCSYELITGFLNPLEVGGYIIAALFIFFQFLPTHYFQAWLKKIFSWAFPLSVILVLATQDGPSFFVSFSRAAVVQILGIFFGAVSLLFILAHYFNSKKTK